MSDEAIFLIIDIKKYSLLVPITIGLLFYRSLSNPLRWLLILLLTFIPFEIITDYFAANSMNSYLFVSFGMTITFILLWKVFLGILGKQKYLWVGIGSIVAVFTVNYLLESNPENMLIWPLTLQSATFIVMPGYYLFKAVDKPKHRVITMEPYFWLSMSVLFFSAGTYMTYLFSNALRDTIPNQQLIYIWLLENFLWFCLYVGYTITFIMARKQWKPGITSSYSS